MPKEIRINTSVARKMREDGLPWSDIAKRFNCSIDTVIKRVTNATEEETQKDVTVNEYRGLINDLIAEYIDMLKKEGDLDGVDVMRQFTTKLHQLNFDLFPIQDGTGAKRFQ